MAVRKQVSLKITGNGTQFTLQDLEQFVHRARDMQMPVNGAVYITHEQPERPGGSPVYSISISGEPSAGGQPDD